MESEVEGVSRRYFAWTKAKEIVDPIVEQHGLETFRNPAVGGMHPIPFGSTGYNISKVDQHLAHILEIADWLMSDG